jgi:chlorobactene glucosyltransferase
MQAGADINGPSSPGTMLPLAIVGLLLALSVLVLLFHGVAIVLALQMPRIDPAPPGATSEPLPTVSVIVAARNEEVDLPACLEGLLAQDRPATEILVVDGASEDRTAAIAASYGPRVRLLREPPLPPGWVGKNWGCQLGAGEAKGELLVFTDADVRHHPATLRTAVAWLRGEAADVGTLVPRTEAGSFWERVVMPFQTQMVLTYFRAPRANRDSSSAAALTGQFWITTREAYEAVGGHAAVRGYVLEDVRLAQLYRAAGKRLRVGWAPELLVTRMYRDREEMFEGLLKNVHGTEYRAARQVGFLAGLIGLFWLPLGLLPLGWYEGSLPLVGMGAFLWIALFGKHVGFTRGTRLPAVYGLFFPLAAGYYVALVAASLRHQGRRASVVWKGRRYAT